jgi:hypothetical protein
MQRIHVFVLAAALAIPILGCKADPRVRPVKMGPVDTGATSIEAVRRQLKGTWELTALELFSPSGEKTTADAKGRLQYDEYGNLSMQGSITGTATIDPSMLNLSGRIAIDPNAHTLQIMRVDAPTQEAKRVDPRLGMQNVRYYEFPAVDVLKTTIKDAKGATTATATWKKIE